MEPRRTRTLARPAPLPARTAAVTPAPAARAGAALSPARNTATLTQIIRQAERPTVPPMNRATAPEAMPPRVAEQPSPAQTVALAQTAAPVQTTAPAQTTAPVQTVALAQTAAPAQAAAPAQTVAPTQAAAPAQMAAPATSAGTTSSTGTSAATSTPRQDSPRTLTGAPPKASAVEKPGPARGTEGGAKTEAPTEGAGGATSEATAPRAGGGAGLLMPEPPASPSPATQERIAATSARAAETASAQASLPPEEEQVTDAREAVTPPIEEREALAQSNLVELLGQQPEPSPEIEQLCERIREVIRNKRPPDEDSLVEARPDEMAREAGAEVGRGVQGEVSSVEGAYASLQQEPAPAPASIGEELPPTPEVAPTPPIDAQSATPDPVPAANVSLNADVAANQQRMADAGMMSEPAQLVQEGPIAEARSAQGELEETAATAPAEVLAQQEATLNRTRGDMVQLQEAALEALRTSRTRTATQTRTQQEGMVGTEEQLRQQASARAQRIFDDAQRAVQDLLRPLTDTAMRRWEAGIQRLAANFRADLREVERSIEERHSGVGGALLSLWDSVTGLPGWVVKAYDRAERIFGDGACELARDISRQVNGVIATCEAIIEQAREDIADVFAQLPESLQEWAAGEQARLGQELDALRDSAHQQRDQFNQQLVQQASQAVQEVRQEIHGLRERAKGLIGRIADAINAFLEDPARFIINGLLSLLGIPPSTFWAVVARIREVISDIADDPLGFAGNLLRAVGDGFRLFFDNIGTHLLNGLLEWLFSGLGSVGVQLPRDMSLGSIVTFFLQLMGITWERIRRLLARHIGERNVELLEQAWTLISTLVEQGPAGIFEMLKERLDPREILDQVLAAARDAIIEAVITRVTARLLMMFNPVGAILQAIEAIYRVLKWIFENAARIFSLVETVVNGIADIISGNTGALSVAIEQGLARLMAPVIDFLAGYLGLGNLPDHIRGAIERLQGWVEGILDRVIGWLVARAQALMRAVGLNREEEAPPAEGETRAAEADTELGETVTFRAGGETHRMWVDVQGTQATLMVASTPTSVTELLDRWHARLGELSDAPDENGVRPRQRAESLLIQAQALARAADTSADVLAQNWRSVATTPAPTGTSGAAPAPPDDSQLEAQERQLATVLSQLFALFDPNAATASPVVRFTPQLAQADGAAQPLLRRALTEHASAFQGATTWEAARGLFTTDSLTQDMLQRPLLKGQHAFGDKFHARAIKEVQKALTDVGAPAEERTDEKAERTLSNFKSSLHGGQAPFANAKPALVNQIFAENRIAATDAAIYHDYKARFQSEVQGLHDKYKPRNLRWWKGNTIITYEGLGDARFTVALADGHVQRIRGRNLRHKRDLGIIIRGKLQQTSTYVPDRSMANAHLIPDQFLGPGQKESRNIITTSAHFNSPVMASAERTIKEAWTSYLDSLRELSLDTTTVTFDLDVKVSWMEIFAPGLIPRIMREAGDKLLAHYPHWDKNNLEREIEAKLNTGLIGASPDLKRVANVEYTMRIRGPGAPPPLVLFTGPDLWLGFHDVRFTN